MSTAFVRGRARLIQAVLAVLVALTVSPPSIAVAEDTTVRMGAFEPFTIYAHDGAFPDRMQSEVIVLLHGFKSGMPNQDYDALESLLGAEYTLIGFNYDYTDIEANEEALADLFRNYLQTKRVVVIGTSLGGYWAEYILNSFPVHGAILINPAMRPQGVLRNNIGDVFSKRRQTTVTVTERHARDYETHRWKNTPSGQRLVLLSLDDELIAPAGAQKLFGEMPNSRIAEFAEGGHNITLDRPDVAKTITDFVRQVAPSFSAREAASETVSFKASPSGWPNPAIVSPRALEPGLAVQYYFAKFNNLRELRPTAETRRGKVGAPLADVNWVGNRGNVMTSGKPDFVGAKITGFLRIPEAGAYAFRFYTNDGFEMILDGREIYSDPTVHKDRLSPEVPAVFNAAGLYPIQMLYFEKKGSSTLRLEWRPPGATEFSVVPAEAFKHSPPQG